LGSSSAVLAFLLGAVGGVRRCFLFVQQQQVLLDVHGGGIPTKAAATMVTLHDSAAFKRKVFQMVRIVTRAITVRSREPAFQ
jgi:hypothetical protein